MTEAVDETTEHAAGMTVYLRGLKAPTDLSGRRGALGLFYHDLGRWVVTMDDGSQVRVLAQHLAGP